MPPDKLELSSPSASRGVTRSAELREKIEEEIAIGVFKPGTRLDEAELAVRFGVSRTPIREALIQLASMGILQIRPRRGAVVPKLTPHRLVEMFEVMAELEAMCGRLAARRMSEADHCRLVETHRDCAAAFSSGDADAYYFKNELFHHVIYAGSHNSFLAEQASMLHRRLRPQRRLQLRLRDRVANSFDEHERIVQAMLAGDAEQAGELLRSHVVVQGERFADLMALLHRVDA